jgi:bisphosphoglycerate-independent phosphoglycerate mutase (AlkP superfamily)
MATILPPKVLTRVFGEVVADAGLTQLRLAETE